MNKKIIIVLVLIILLAFLNGCGANKETKEIDIKKLTDEIIKDVDYPEMTKLEGNKILNYYQNIDIDLLEDFDVNLKSDLSAADEITVFKLKNKDDKQMVLDSIDKRIEALKKAVLDYNPSQTQRIDDALLFTTEHYIFFAVSDDNKKIEEIINSYL